MAYLGTPIDTTNQFQSLQGKRFNGDGSTTAFTLDIAPSSVLDIEVFVENVRQDPNSAYSLSGTTLTFTGAPPSGTNNIYVVHQAKAVGTIEVLDGAITTAKLGADAVTEAKIADDAVESEHLNDNIISGQTALTSAPADTDELLISDAGTLKRIDVSLVGGKNTPAWHGTKDSAQALSRAAHTKITGFSTDELDSDGAFDGTTFTVPSGKGGEYFIYFSMYADYGTSSGGDGEYSIAQIYVNGSSEVDALIELKSGSNTNSDVIQVHVTAMKIQTLAAGDTVEAYGYLKDEDGSGDRFVARLETNFGGYRLIGA
jgi:hypothetical protein